MEIQKDIFISYKNDGEGNNFAARLKDDLDSRGYTVYFNSHEQKSGSFPDRLRTAIENCHDFILILSAGCLRQLIENNSIDWVREEILHAKSLNKNIIPILTENTKMPSDCTVMPEALQFLPKLEAISLPEQYLSSPFEKLTGSLISKPENESLKNTSNSNSEYNVQNDMIETLKKAENGDIQAMFEIGNMYFYGFTSPDDNNGHINYTEAAKWLLKVSESNHELSPHADSIIARMYYSGVMPYEEQSFKKCFSYYEKAASLGLGIYYERIGFMKSTGVGTKFNYDDILAFFDSCSEDSPNTVKINIAKFYINYGLFDKAIEILESIDGSFPDADYRLGLLYQKGLHCNPPAPDVYRAEHHFQNAAQFDHLDAIHALGLLNFQGTYGFRQNLTKARAYYKDAAEKGHRNAQYDYSWMCKNGLGGKRDIETAIYYFEKSAQKGHVLSMAELAGLYQEPECKNYQKAFEWAQKAADAGDPNSQFVLGNLFFFGRGCIADAEKAMIFYRRAYKNGIHQAKFMMEKIKKLQ